MKKLFHKLSHALGQNGGDVVSWHDSEYFYISFKCRGCGEIDEKLTVKTKLQEKDSE